MMKYLNNNDIVDAVYSVNEEVLKEYNDKIKDLLKVESGIVDRYYINRYNTTNNKYTDSKLKEELNKLKLILAKINEVTAVYNMERRLDTINTLINSDTVIEGLFIKVNTATNIDLKVLESYIKDDIVLSEIKEIRGEIDSIRNESKERIKQIDKFNNKILYYSNFNEAYEFLKLTGIDLTKINDILKAKSDRITKEREAVVNQIQSIELDKDFIDMI